MNKKDLNEKVREALSDVVHKERKRNIHQKVFRHKKHLPSIHRRSTMSFPPWYYINGVPANERYKALSEAPEKTLRYETEISRGQNKERLKKLKKLRLAQARDAWKALNELDLENKENFKGNFI